MTPEQKARVSIDTLSLQAGWHVCNVVNAYIRAGGALWFIGDEVVYGRK